MNAFVSGLLDWLDTTMPTGLGIALIVGMTLLGSCLGSWLGHRVIERREIRKFRAALDEAHEQGAWGVLTSPPVNECCQWCGRPFIEYASYGPTCDRTPDSNCSWQSRWS